MKKLIQACPILAGISLLTPLTLEAGLEIADLTDAWRDGFRGYTRVYIDYGENPITEEEWDSYVPSPGYIKNTPRYGHFNAENTFSSPGMPYGEVIVETIDGYTWKFIAQTQSAMWPYNTTLFPDTANAYQAAFNTVTPPPGSIKFSSNEKNQEMIFWAREGNDPEGAPILRYYITDSWGNKYIMGASGAGPDDILEAFNNSVLPEGWTKQTGYLEETISLLPAYGPGNQAHYNIFRDSTDSTFFQFEWGADGGSIAAQIEGMPIWGGATDDFLRIREGDDNAIYGGGGIDTVIFTGNFSDYSVTSWSDSGAALSLSGFGSTKYLYDIQYMEFDDITIATSAVPEPSLFGLLAMGLLALVTCRHRGVRPT